MKLSDEGPRLGEGFADLMGSAVDREGLRNI